MKRVLKQRLSIEKVVPFIMFCHACILHHIILKKFLKCLHAMLAHLRLERAGMAQLVECLTEKPGAVLRQV